ncbi:MAG TPA: peroxiredoxin [Vicinamibacterales bacterium]|jgi:peroxiredoxin
MAAEVGSKAPTFSLKNQDLQDVTVGGVGTRNTVLAFFPAAFTSVCTKEMCTFRDQLAQLNKANAQVYGISIDTPFTLKVFGQQNGLNFPLLSDFNKDVIKAYGVYLDDLVGLKGVAKRAVFVLDRDGVVRYSEVTATPGSEPDYQKLNQAIAAL